MRESVIILNVFLGLLFIADCDALKLKLNSQEDVCILFPDGAILRKPGSCTETIICKDGESSPHTVKCSDDKIVKLDKMNCVADRGKSKDKYCTSTCSKFSPQFTEDKKNCQGWVECVEGQVLQAGNCPDGQVFYKAEQRCIYDNGECDKAYDICQVAKTNQRFWDKKNCQKYNYCNANKKLISGRCPLSTSYDVSTGNCIPKGQVECHQLPMPDEVCGTPKLAIFNRFVSDESTCHGYFYCKYLGISEDGNYIPDESPDWKQCKDIDTFFDAATESCRDMNYVKCSEDRCVGRKNDHILSETQGCQHYFVCKDGYTADEVKCPDNKYFDPTVGYCVDEPIWYPICN